jgi:hypothetical protein
MVKTRSGSGSTAILPDPGAASLVRQDASPSESAARAERPFLTSFAETNRPLEGLMERLSVSGPHREAKQPGARAAQAMA